MQYFVDKIYVFIIIAKKHRNQGQKNREILRACKPGISQFQILNIVFCFFTEAQSCKDHHSQW